MPSVRIFRTFLPHAPSVGSRVRITSRFPSLRRRSASTSLWNVVPAPSGPSKTINMPRMVRSIGEDLHFCFLHSSDQLFDIQRKFGRIRLDELPHLLSVFEYRVGTAKELP